MQVHEKKYLKIERQLKRERSKWKMRYLRKGRRIKYQTFCILKALFIICAALYLTAVWGLRDRIFQVRQKNTVIWQEVPSEQPVSSFKETLNKIILRLKTGEIVIYNERTW